MSDSNSSNTSWLEDITSCKNDPVLICDLSDLTWLIIFDTWWTSMNVGSKHSITWNNSRQVPCRWFYIPSQIEETSSNGIMYIVCDQVLCHPSQHQTSSMWKHLLAIAHIPKLHELTGSEVSELTSSTVNEIVFAILKRQGSQGITIVRSKRTFIWKI